MKEKIIFEGFTENGCIDSTDANSSRSFTKQDITALLVFDYPKFQELLYDTLQSRNIGMKSVGTKEDLRKMNLKFFT